MVIINGTLLNNLNFVETLLLCLLCHVATASIFYGYPKITILSDIYWKVTVIQELQPAQHYSFFYRTSINYNGYKTSR